VCNYKFFYVHNLKYIRRDIEEGKGEKKGER
jgi:hypothetical protein